MPDTFGDMNAMTCEKASVIDKCPNHVTIGVTFEQLVTFIRLSIVVSMTMDILINLAFNFIGADFCLFRIVESEYYIL